MTFPREGEDDEFLNSRKSESRLSPISLQRNKFDIKENSMIEITRTKMLSPKPVVQTRYRVCFIDQKAKNEGSSL